jgi:glycosyltransferase involved in cell wall biosynthesis
VRILFLSHYFPPEVNAPASRTYEHCRQWVLDGHDVTVVTCAPNHPRGQVYPGYRNAIYRTETTAGIKVVRLWTFVTPNEGFLKRTLNYVSYMLAAILAIPLLPRTDVVISTSPQFFNGLAGYFVSRLKRAPWVLEIRDLWPESILAVGAIRNRWIIGALEYLERFAYRRADLIIPVTDAFKRYMVAKGVNEAKISVIKNGVDLNFYRAVETGNHWLDRLGVRGKFVAAYFGTHGMAHGLEIIFEAAALLRERDDIVFLLSGDGAERARLLRLRDEMSHSNVIMLDQQPKEEMPYLWALSSASLVLLKKSDVFKTVIPSKIFESMAMQKPVILGVAGESAEIIQAANAGICIEPENPEALACAVKELCDNRARCSELGTGGRAYVVQHFDRIRLARNLISAMQTLPGPMQQCAEAKQKER